MFNFVLPEDSSLKSWTQNNRIFKPDSKVKSYYYQHIPQPPNITYKLFWAPIGVHPYEVTREAEGMSYVTKSLTRSAGTDVRTRGSIFDHQDMARWGVGASHGGFGEVHSAQWRWNLQSTFHFWIGVFNELDLSK